MGYLLLMVLSFLKNAGVQVLILNHHLPPGNITPAHAIVNPNLTQCNFPSKFLAGVGVAFYVMLALRAKLRDLGILLRKPNRILQSY